MKRVMFRFLSLLTLSVFAHAVAAQQTAPAVPNNVGAPPETEIYIVDVVLNGSSVSFGKPVNATQHKGYDNQPYFLPSGDAILYTSEGEDTRMDIWQFDIKTGARTRLTDTPNNSEYSPKLMPDGSGFSVIYEQENRGGQEVRRYRFGDAKQSELMLDVSPVGYHAWGHGTKFLAVFALGNPSTLRLANLETGRVEIMFSNIGRALYALPDGSGYLFTERIDDGQYIIHHLDISSREIKALFGLPGSNEHYALMPNPEAPLGVDFVSASGSKLYFRRGSSGTWEEVVDFTDEGINTITRLAVSPKRNRIAFVVR